VRDGGISSVRAQEIRSPALPHDIRTLSEQGQKENCKLWQVDEWSLPQGNRVHPFRQASESRGFWQSHWATFRPAKKEVRRGMSCC